MMVRRPDLFGAVVCAVPLLDMKIYHTLLAGASWMAGRNHFILYCIYNYNIYIYIYKYIIFIEYGNPDTTDWNEYLKTYSPIHNLDYTKQTTYPPMLMTTSTKDDR